MSSTLTAGDVGGFYQGYYPDFGIGSLSPNTFGGFTCAALITGETAGNITALFNGDATSFLAGLAISVNGTAYSTITSGPSFDGSITTIKWAYGPGNFNTTPGSNEYTIDIGAGGPASPNITSPSTVPNLIGTKLAHTVTIDKTAASMAITGGADSADFEVTGTTDLRFVGDALSDTAGDLVVEVTVTDTDGLTATQTITVPVKYILYVGGKTWSRAGATTTTNVSLTDLTGGIASAPAENDYVVVMQGIGSNADRAVATTSGYTELADIYANGTTYDANLGVDAKFMGSTPDTTVTIGSSGSANDAQAARIMVFRGVDLTTPMDVAVVTATGTGTAKPNPGAITPITTGAVGVFSGAQAAATAAALTSSDLTAFASVNQADTNDIAVGAGYIEWSGSGAMDPAVFGGGSNNSANSWAAVSIALRPAYTSGGGSQNLTLPSISSTATLYGPTLAPGAVSVSLPNIASGATLYAPTLAASQSLSLPTIAASGALYAPTLTAGAASISLPFVGAASALYAPTIAPGAVNITLPAIASGSQLFAPSLAPQAVSIAIPALASTAATFAPTLTAGATSVALPHIASGALLFAPSVEPGAVDIALPHIASAATLFAPAIVGEGQIALPFIAANDNLFAPELVAIPVEAAPGDYLNPLADWAPRVNHDRKRREDIEAIMRVAESEPAPVPVPQPQPLESPAPKITDFATLEGKLSAIEASREAQRMIAAQIEEYQQFQDDEEAALLLLVA